MNSLDTLVAQMMMRARQVERAVHDPGPWTIRTAEGEFPARKVVGDDHVTFIAIIDLPRQMPTTLRGMDVQLIELCCNGETVAIRHMVPIGQAQVSWSFQIEEPVAA